MKLGPAGAAAFADQHRPEGAHGRGEEARSGDEGRDAKQLGDCNYAIAAREVIRDACEVGSGIIKGPVSAEDNIRRAWVQSEETSRTACRPGA
jgi:hypothetical protein